MDVLCAKQEPFSDCVIHTPPPLDERAFPEFNARMVPKSIVAANHAHDLDGLYGFKEDPWVSAEITDRVFPMGFSNLVYFWAGYLTSKADKDTSPEIFRDAFEICNTGGWTLGGIEHLFLLARLFPDEITVGSSIVGLRQLGEVRGEKYWLRLMRGEGLSLVPFKGNIAPVTRVLIVHERRY